MAATQSREVYASGHELCGHTAPLSSARFSPDGGAIATSSADKTLRLWQAATGKCTTVLSGHAQGISDVAWAPDGSLLASASDDHTVRIWDTAAGRAIAKPLRGHLNNVMGVDVSPRGNLIASASFDESARLWDVRSGRCVRAIPAHSEPVTSARFNGDGTVVVTGSYDGLIRLWDVASGQCLKTIQDESVPPIAHVCFSPNGRFLLAACLDGRLRLYDALSAQCVRTFAGHACTRLATAPAFLRVTGGSGAPPQQRVACGGEDGRTLVWEVNGAREVAALPTPTGAAVLCVDAHPTADVLLTAGTEAAGVARLWVRREGGGADS